MPPIKREPKHVDLSRFKNLDIQSFAMVPIDGNDVVRAAERVIPIGGDKPLDPNLFSILHQQQVVAGSIVEVNGEPVRGGACQASITWNSRTRRFISKTFDFLNATTEAEDQLFEHILSGTATQPEEEQTESARSLEVSSASTSLSAGI